MKILVGLTGSIACYKTCTLISSLVKAGHEVQVVATTSALRFVGEATLEGLTSRAVLSDTFARGHAMDHIDFARWADLFIVAPLTANHAALFAGGFGEDLLSTLFLAYEAHKPLLLAPAMNSIMWQNAAVKENMQKLAQRGAQLCEPNEGRLACGEVGPGKMCEPEDLFKMVEAALQTRAKAAGKNILVTFGGTRELIDGVRAITNLSTGSTGAKICDELTRAGYNVTALAATTAVTPTAKMQIARFESHGDLNEQLRTLLRQKQYTAVVHLAAVSDYTVSSVRADGQTFTGAAPTKLISSKEVLLTLKPTAKLVNLIKEYAHDPKPTVIAFKLTNAASPAESETAIAKLFASPGVDFVVHNDQSEIDRATGKHPFTLYSHSQVLEKFTETQGLAHGLTQLFKGGPHGSLS